MFTVKVTITGTYHIDPNTIEANYGTTDINKAVEIDQKNVADGMVDFYDIVESTDETQATFEVVNDTSV